MKFIEILKLKLAKKLLLHKYKCINKKDRNILNNLGYSIKPVITRIATNYKQTTKSN